MLLGCTHVLIPASRLALKPSGSRVAVGMSEVIGCSVEFDCGIVPATEAILLSLLLCNLAVVMNCLLLIPVLPGNLLGRISIDGASPQRDWDGQTARRTKGRWPLHGGSASDRNGDLLHITYLIRRRILNVALFDFDLPSFPIILLSYVRDVLSNVLPHSLSIIVATGRWRLEVHLPAN